MRGHNKALVSYPIASNRGALILVIMAAVVALAGCSEGCVGASMGPPVERAEEYADAIPAQSKLVIFAEELQPMLNTLGWVLEVFPLEASDLDTSQGWEAIGARRDGPAAVFWADGQWVILVDSKIPESDDERRLEITDWPARGEREILEGSDYAGWIEAGDEDQWTRWMTTDGRRVALGFSPDRRGAELGQKIWNLEDGQRWSVSPSQRQVSRLRDDAVEPVVYGTVDASHFASQLKGEGRAGLLRDQMALRMGRVYWHLGARDGGESYEIDILTPGGLDGAAGGMLDLGEADDMLPDLGGLARAGVPMVARLSADPRNFVSLILTALGAEERARVEELLDDLRDELQVDLRQKILDNLKGQVAVVVFSLEDGFFEKSGIDLVASIFRLQATREAVVIPFRDRDEIQRGLDAFTQLSQGRLRRQAMEHTIQYAWFDDGALEWALILGDEHLVLVDSIVAFDHVRSWERSPRPLEGVFVEHGVDKILDNNRGIAAYVDLATLRSLARESGADSVTEWLNPVNAARIETDVDGRTDHSRLVIWPSSRALEEAR